MATAQTPTSEHSAQRQEHQVPPTTQEVTPWEVKGGEDGRIEYQKLAKDVDCSLIGQEIVERIESLTGKPAHAFLTRSLFYAHRGLNEILASYERGEPFYLYTGLGPSSKGPHLGHLIPLTFTKYLQDAFKVPVVIQITDDEKTLWRDLEQEEAERWAKDNIKDIITLGFDPCNTFIFTNYEYLRGEMYKNVIRIRRQVTIDTTHETLGLTWADNIGKIGFAAIQAAPTFCTSFPHMFGTRKDLRCLTVCGIDQDAFFRLTQDAAPMFGFHKPAIIMSKLLPALPGEGTKMSASLPNSAIYLNDSLKQVKEKINKHAFSGGGATKEQQELEGADLAVDVPFMWLRVFLKDDTELLAITREYFCGKILTGQVKKQLIQVLQGMVKAHQEARAEVTDARVEEFTKPRPMQNCLESQ